jgi:2-succinyl-6-hydroxy-2,4-cyclohexadiene-1-carboxylate synthase
MPFIKLNTVAFHYVTVGQPTNPPFLLLHGFLGSHQDFLQILPALSQHFYCIIPDLPGHGHTLTRGRGYNFLFMAQAISDFVDALELQTIYLLGYSLGGRIALYLSCFFPGRCRRTIVESASPGLKTEDERWDRSVRDHELAYQLHTTPLADFLTQWYSNPLFASLKEHPDTYAAMYQRRLQNNTISLGDVLHSCSLGRQPSLWETLLELDACPLNPDKSIRLFAGELDNKFVEINQEIVTCCPQTASLKIFEACGHNIHLEAPNAYAQAVIEYLVE